MRATDNNSSKDDAAKAYATRRKKQDKRASSGKRLKPKTAGEKVMNYMNPTRNA